MSDYKTSYLLDPELAAFASDNNEMVAPFRSMEKPPKDGVALNALRDLSSNAFPMGNASEFDVRREEVFIPRDVGPDVRCLLYIPNDDASARPGYVHMHGGGYVFGSPEVSDLANLQYAQQLGAVICSVDYRMGPENPIPAPLDDCYAALAWIHDNAETWCLDRSRIAIGGESAGGGMAAALAIYARDKGDYSICHQHLACPMLDNRTGSDEYPGDPLTGEFVWTRASNQFGWKSHLGNAEAVAPQVPARLKDFANLPSTWIHVTGMDLFRDESIKYANALMKVGVPTELIVVPGAPHGFNAIPGTKMARRFGGEHLSALAKALGVDL